MKNLRDYLHLYIGSARVEYDSSYMRDLTPSEYGIARHVADNVKLVLRPLSDMTKEEAVYIKRILRDNHGIDTIKTVLKNGWHLGHIGANASQMFQITQYLLSKGFDLFGLIEDGLAIDASETK